MFKNITLKKVIYTILKLIAIIVIFIVVKLIRKYFF